MYAPEGFSPINYALQWCQERGDRFFRECALPWVAENDPTGKDMFDRDFLEFALRSRMLLIEWLVSNLLQRQPVPLYLSAPSGTTMQASPTFFLSQEMLHWFEFEWPLTDAGLVNIAKKKTAEEILSGKSTYYIFDIQTGCIVVPSETEIQSFPDADAVRKLSRTAAPFDGWSVCIRNEDVDRIQKILSSMFSWPHEVEEITAPIGRPRKQEAAADVYTALFPNGHGALGITWATVEQMVSKALRQTVSIYTIKRGLKMRTDGKSNA